MQIQIIKNRLCTKAKNYEERYRERLKKTLIERERQREREAARCEVRII